MHANLLHITCVGAVGGCGLPRELKGDQTMRQNPESAVPPVLAVRITWLNQGL